MHRLKGIDWNNAQEDIDGFGPRPSVHFHPQDRPVFEEKSECRLEVEGWTDGEPINGLVVVRLYRSPRWLLTQQIVARRSMDHYPELIWESPT